VFRTEGILSDAIRNARVAFVGCGGSSYAVEKFARLSPGRLLVVDGDEVELSNLERTSFFRDQVGLNKAEALARNLRRINPELKVEVLGEFLNEGNVEVLKGYDFVFCGVDDFRTKLLINDFCYREGIPVVYASFHSRIAGGRVVWVNPEDSTPCYRCVDFANCKRFEEGEELDLKAEPGIIADAQLVDSVALKVLLALVDRGRDTSYGRFYEAIRGKNDIIVKALPDYAFGDLLFDAIFGEVDPQERDEIREILGVNFVAYLKVGKAYGCSVCGR